MTDKIEELPQGLLRNSAEHPSTDQEIAEKKKLLQRKEGEVEAEIREEKRVQYLICDKQFMDDVIQLKALRSYMFQQAKKITQTGPIELGQLNLLHFAEDGRLPSSEEWSSLEHQTNVLYGDLAEPDRRRFLYSQFPPFVIKTAGVFSLFALISLLVAFAATLMLSHDTTFFKLAIFTSFLMWLAALGGIGSIAFIGMNALAVEQDATFDITNKKLIGLRVLLGALFAVVLTLPFGYGSFKGFVTAIQTEPPEPTTGSALKSILLLLPFVLGFSTTLVIMIMNRFVDAVQTFFGKSNTLPAPPAASDTQT
jgi:hypothetical protein